MKCCGSPTTSIAANAAAPAPSAATNALQAVIFSDIFKPFAQALGPVGDVVIGSIAQELFVKPPR